MIVKPLTRIRSLPRRAQFFLVATFLVNVGSQSATPFFILYLHLSQHLSIAASTAILAVALGLHQGLGLFGGTIADRFGHRRSIAIGLLMRGVAYGLYIVGHHVPAVFLGVIMFGVGSALFNPSGKAAFAASLSQETTETGFRLRSSAVFAASIVGPLIGSVIYAAGAAPFTDLFLFSLTFQVSPLLVFLSVVRPHTTRTAASNLVQQIMNPVRDHHMRILSMEFALFFLTDAIVHFAVPLVLARLGYGFLTGAAFSFLAVAAIGTQMFAVSRPTHRGHRSVMTLGFVAVSLGTVLFAAVDVGGIWMIPVSMMLWGIGEGMLVPAIEIMVSRVALHDHRAGYFGFLGIAGGTGGVIGNLAGGVAFHHLEGGWFWLAVALPPAIATLAGWRRPSSSHVITDERR